MQQVHVALQNKRPKTVHFIFCACLTGRDQKQLRKICHKFLLGQNDCLCILFLKQICLGDKEHAG